MAGDEMEVEVAPAGSADVGSTAAPALDVEEGHAVEETVLEPKAEADQEGDVQVTTVETDDAESESKIRSDALFLHGVDDLSTKDIEAFVQHYYGRPFVMEWVNDSSVNIVYDDPEDAYQCLVAITAEQEFDTNDRIEPTQLRQTRKHPTKDVPLSARFSEEKDRKSERSREKSRYYTLHGAPSRREDKIRFGSSRSAPMKFGLDEVDLLPLKKRSARRNDSGGDLFPHKLSRRARKRGGKRGRRGEIKSVAEPPDLFGHLLTESKVEKPEPREKKTNIYSNMDY